MGQVLGTKFWGNLETSIDAGTIRQDRDILVPDYVQKLKSAAMR